MIELERIGFGGGCHWCTEAVFQALRGVARVDQGFIAATPPDDSFSEAVIVHYDSGIIALETLVEIHLRTHSSMSSHKLRGKYRSAVYVFDEQQEQQTLRNLSAIQMDFAAPLVTRVLRFSAFRASDPRYQNYYAVGPDRPFCKTYIDPKLALLRRKFADQMQPGQHVDEHSHV